MYTVNHKIVCLSIALQIVCCAFWILFSPNAFQVELFDISILIVFFSIISSVYFYAWVLSKMRTTSKIEMCVVIFSMWLFFLLPNLLIAKTILLIDIKTAQYVITFSAAATFINAFTLPFFQSSRSIFKS